MFIRRPTTRSATSKSTTSPAKSAAKAAAQRKAFYARDELSTGRGGALRARAAQFLQASRPVQPTTVTVQPGDSYWSIAQRRATEVMAQQGLKPSDPSYQATWNRLSYAMVQDLQASNGNRPLRPGDQLTLPDPAKYGLIPGLRPAAPAPASPTAPEGPGPMAPGAPATPAAPGAPEYVPPAEVGAAMVNQFDGDSNGSNANCGFASSLMALKLLGIDSPQLRGLSSDYDKAMMLRKLGGGGTSDTAWGTVAQVVNGLNAAGANASVVPNTWGANKLGAVDAMKQAFLSGEATAFVCAGNPHLGWPDKVSYNGGHFVTVAGYDPQTDTFTVLDPVARQPIQVTPDQLANYMKDTNAEHGEVIQVRR